jgi:glycosyltransferase involved in cell wall biosynthesis
MTTRPDHISVCICTFKRPKLLARLLGELQNQITNNLFTYSAVVVDNDHAQSANDTVTSGKKNAGLVIDYFVEPEQNIALARNKAIENASGNFLAFIDDDEFPESTWLLNLYKTIHKFSADGVLGPVKPHFEAKPPRWVVNGKICELPSYKTGKVLRANQTRTGNVLFAKQIFQDQNNRFDPKFGRTGGEDIDFFKRMTKKGRVFVWCNEAPVYETVPPERWKISFHLKKFLRAGGLAGENMRKAPLRGIRFFIKFAGGLTLYLLFLPFSFLFGPQVYVSCLKKAVYHFAWIFGYLGFVMVRYKND